MNPDFSEVADALLAFADCMYTVDEVIEATGVDRARAEQIIKTIEALRD